LRFSTRWAIGLLAGLAVWACHEQARAAPRDGEAASGSEEVSPARPERASLGGAVGIEQAESSLREYVFDRALAEVEAALSSGGLSLDLLRRALKVRAESLSALNRPEDAQQAYARLLSIQPDFDIDDRLGPRIRSPFFDARAFLDEQAERPGLTLSIRENRSGRVHVRVHDPLSMIGKVVVHHRPRGGRGAYSAVALSARGGIVPLSDGGAHEVYVRALTPEKSVAFELGAPAKPVSTEIPGTTTTALPARHKTHSAPLRPTRPAVPRARSGSSSSVFESPVFWVIAGVVVTGAAATGIVFATR